MTERHPLFRTFAHEPEAKGATDRAISAVQTKAASVAATPLSAEVRHLFKQVLMATPAGFVSHTITGQGAAKITVAEVLAQVAVLADGLTDAIRENTALKAEVAALKAERAAARQFFLGRDDD